MIGARDFGHETCPCRTDVGLGSHVTSASRDQLQSADPNMSHDRSMLSPLFQYLIQPCAHGQDEFVWTNTWL